MDIPLAWTLIWVPVQLAAQEEAASVQEKPTHEQADMASQQKVSLLSNMGLPPLSQLSALVFTESE